MVQIYFFISRRLSKFYRFKNDLRNQLNLREILSHSKLKNRNNFSHYDNKYRK